MRKIFISLIICVVNFCSAFAQADNPPSSVSVVETYQKQCPFNAADFGSNEAIVTAITPPSAPLRIRLEVNWPYEAVKERLNEVWFSNIDEAVSALAESEGFYNCAKACYNLGVPIEMEYYSTIDKKSVLTPISVEALNRLFRNKK